MFAVPSADCPEKRSNKEVWVAGATLIVSQGDAPIMLNVECGVPVVSELRVHGYPLLGRPLLPVATLEGCGAADCLWTWTRLSPEGQTADNVLSHEMIYTPTREDLGCCLLVQCQPRIPGTCCTGLPLSVRVGAGKGQAGQKKTKKGSKGSQHGRKVDQATQGEIMSLVLPP